MNFNLNLSLSEDIKSISIYSAESFLKIIQKYHLKRSLSSFSLSLVFFHEDFENLLILINHFK